MKFGLVFFLTTWAVVVVHGNNADEQQQEEFVVPSVVEVEEGLEEIIGPFKEGVEEVEEGQERRPQRRRRLSIDTRSFESFNGIATEEIRLSGSQVILGPGARGTGWHLVDRATGVSTRYVYNGYVTLELGKEGRLINAIQVFHIPTDPNWANAAIKYQNQWISISSDGETWHTLWETGDEYGDAVTKITFPLTRARYVRHFSGDGNDKYDQIKGGITELKVWGVKSPAKVMVTNDNSLLAYVFNNAVYTMSGKFADGRFETLISDKNVIDISIPTLDSEDLVWCVTKDGTAWRYNTGTSAWTDLSTGLPSNGLVSIDVSANGQYALGISNNGYGFPGGLLYARTRSGSTWSQVATSNTNWLDVAQNSDGSSVLALTTDGSLYSCDASGAATCDTDTELQPDGVVGIAVEIAGHSEVWLTDESEGIWHGWIHSGVISTWEQMDGTLTAPISATSTGATYTVAEDGLGIVYCPSDQSRSPTNYALACEFILGPYGNFEQKVQGPRFVTEV